jgi:multimeric flavodoxin WrbA
MKRLLLHDISSFHFEGILGTLPGDVIPVAATPPVHHCIGCFGCWIRTPGRCVIADRAQDFAVDLADADELIIMSRLYLGGLSPDIKAFMDRMIPSMLPFFELKDGLMRHPKRGNKGIRLTYYFYKDAASAPESALITSESDDRHLIEVAEDHLQAAASAQTLPEKERSLMLRLAKANATNMRTTVVDVTFVGDLLALKEVRL